MAHDADHSNSQHADRRRTIAPPVAYPVTGHIPSDIEALLRATHRIRLRSHDLGQVAAGGQSSAGGTVPSAGDADS
jgi:hypothetical protein